MLGPMQTLQRRINELSRSEAYLDRRHPDHPFLVEEVAGLYEEMVKATEAGAGAASGSPLTPQQRDARIAELNARLRDREIPLRAAAREEVLAELNMVLNMPVAGDPGAVGGATATEPAALRQRIDELSRQPAYLDRNHADHSSTLSEVSGLYSQLAAAQDGTSGEAA
jgi:hypothetical protein